MSKGFLHRLSRHTDDSPINFAGWLALLLITLMLCIITYFFIDSYPKDDRPLDIELPQVPTRLSNMNLFFCDPRSIKIELTQNGNYRICKAILSPELMKIILKKSVDEYGVDSPILICADKKLPFREICQVLEILTSLNIYKPYFAVILSDTNQICYLSFRYNLGVINYNLLPMEYRKKIEIDLLVKVGKEQIFMNNKPVEFVDLSRILRDSVSKNPDLKCIIIPDPDISVQRLLDVIYEFERQKVNRVSVEENADIFKIK